MRYTTVSNIKRRLRGRLNVDSLNLIPNAASGEVEGELIDQIGSQVEAKLNLALSQVYVLPIPRTATESLKILESIVEKLIVSEIATVHFQQTQSPELGGDAGFGSVLRKQAIQDLESLLHGHGIYIPGIMQPPPTNAAEGVFRQPLVLPGVKLVPQSDRADTFTRSYSFVEQKVLNKEEQIQWG